MSKNRRQPAPGREAAHAEPADGSAVDALLQECRRHLSRVHPRDLARESAAGALVIDIRPFRAT